jgi:ABC-type transport system involved in Fe-S cluster assembly fused permease/ATPase subunit
VGKMSSLRYALSLVWSETDAYARRSLVIALAMVTAFAMITALSPIAFALLVDEFAMPDDEHGRWLPVLLLGAYVLSQFLIRAISAARDLLFGRGGQRFYRHISRRLFDHIVRLPLRFHLERKTGAMGETLTQGLHGYQLLLQHLIYTILPALVEFATIVIVLVGFGHPVYLAIYVVAGVLYVLAFRAGAAAVTEPARLASQAQVETQAVLTDSLLNFEAIKYFDAERAVYERYDQALARTESAWKVFFGRRSANSLVVGAIFAGSVAAALGLAGYEVMVGSMSIGAFVLVNSYMLRITVPLEMLGFAVRDVSQGLAFLDRMFDLFKEQPEIGSVRNEGEASPPQKPSQAGQEPASPLQGELRFEDVTFSYRADRTVLRNVDFSVPAGNVLAIVGISGSGKSSLIRLLFRLCDPDSGRILLNGVPIADIPLSELRRSIAIVPQDLVLFNDTIGNNIAFGRWGSTQEEIEQAARLAHLHSFIAGLPEGYNTTVGERGLKLSGGERQRIAIARAALKRPRIFVFDEATSSLDTRTEREILRNLTEVSQGCTTLVIAHRLSTVVHADEILVLERGVVVERGTHKSLLQANGSYASLWRAQQHVATEGAGISTSSA